ncbi:hypothetical protein SAMN04487911_12173 [Arenibacter nanhaiticus]|uniref:Uncharacterized protein n=1 Tax=Arenibacter nanhaiticus TaxID=558155 RepID=A0A1M6JEG3_9FLAO|nr:hypothetical protein SAMN04487911_12173 [Arenibacter nanhaiticus]
MNKTNRAENRRYSVPLVRGAGRSHGQRTSWPLATNANRCIFRSVLIHFFDTEVEKPVSKLRVASYLSTAPAGPSRQMQIVAFSVRS